MKKIETVHVGIVTTSTNCLFDITVDVLKNNDRRIERLYAYNYVGYCNFVSANDKEESLEIYCVDGRFVGYFSDGWNYTYDDLRW